jgi:hypothetical protein
MKNTREPQAHTPIVFDYLWLYWVLKHYIHKAFSDSYK